MRNDIVEITTVIGCSMRCEYCPQSLLTKEYKSNTHKMSVETFKLCISKIPEHVKLNFAGFAEPWLNPNCTEMVLQASKRGPIATFTTLSGMTLNDAKKIEDLPFTHFCIHLPDADERMKLKVTDEYLDVLDCCKNIPTANLVVYGKLHPLVKKRLGFDVPSSDNSLHTRAGNLSLIQIKHSGKIKCASCGDPPRHVVLLPDGRVSLCCMDYGLKHIIGDLTKMCYEDLFNSDEYLKVLDGLLGKNLDTLCRRCENVIMDNK